MNHIMQFSFFFNEPTNYVLKSDFVRSQLEERLRLSVEGYFGLCSKGRTDKIRKMGYVDPRRAPKDLDYSALPSIFVSMVTKDFADKIIRSKYYEKDLTFIMDIEITPEEVELYQEDRLNGNTLFAHLFDRYEWTEYNISSVILERQSKLENYIKHKIYTSKSTCENFWENSSPNELERDIRFLKRNHIISQLNAIIEYRDADYGYQRYQRREMFEKLICSELFFNFTLSKNLDNTLKDMYNVLVFASLKDPTHRFLFLHQNFHTSDVEENDMLHVLFHMLESNGLITHPEDGNLNDSVLTDIGEIFLPCLSEYLDLDSRIVF